MPIVLSGALSPISSQPPCPSSLWRHYPLACFTTERPTSRFFRFPHLQTSFPAVDCSLCPSSTSLQAQRVSERPSWTGPWDVRDLFQRWWSELECPHRRRTASEWGATLLGKGSSGPRATAARIPGHLHTMVRGSMTCHSVPSFCSQPLTNLSFQPRSVGSDQLGKGLGSCDSWWGACLAGMRSWLGSLQTT